VAAKDAVPPPPRDTVDGATVIPTGTRLTVAIAVLLGSKVLVAVRVTVCAAEIDAGAVYVLPVTLPTAGVKVQVTVVLEAFATVGVNVWVCFTPSVAAAGAIVTETGSSVRVTLAEWFGSAELVAVTVTVCWVGISAGAEYTPATETIPAPVLGMRVQETAVLVLPVTVAVYVWACPAGRVAFAGPTETATGINVKVTLAALVGSAMLVATTVAVC
jgi:hypothetical protein